jgi:hypothetical protein
MAAMVRSSGPQDFKIAVLGVPAELIAVHTAVSQPVAEAMATGVPVFFALPWPVNGWSAVLLVPYLAWICYDCSDARRAMSAADCCVTKLDESAGGVGCLRDGLARNQHQRQGRSCKIWLVRFHRSRLLPSVAWTGQGR